MLQIDVVETAEASAGSGRRGGARARPNTLARIHWAAGFATLALFLISGQYMKHHAPPVRDLEPGLHLMFTSRHIYMLAAALVHLGLGAYIVPHRKRGRHALQWIGSAALTVSAVLLIAAFVAEPMAGKYRGPFSSYGLYALFAGTLLHVISSPRGRD
jgi:hypothetical protein